MANLTHGLCRICHTSPATHTIPATEIGFCDRCLDVPETLEMESGEKMSGRQFLERYEVKVKLAGLEEK